MHEADVCKVIPTRFSGGKEVVPLQMRKLVRFLLIEFGHCSLMNREVNCLT